MLLSIVLDYTYIGQPSNQTHMLEAFHIVSVNLSFFFLIVLLGIKNVFAMLSLVYFKYICQYDLFKSRSEGLTGKFRNGVCTWMNLASASTLG